MANLLVQLLLGAAVNLGVAWACSWWGVPCRIGSEPMAADKFWAKRRLAAKFTRGDQPVVKFTSFGIVERHAFVQDWDAVLQRDAGAAVGFPESLPPFTALEFCAQLDSLHNENNPDHVMQLDLEMHRQLMELRTVTDAPPALRVDAGWPMLSFCGWGPASVQSRASPLGPLVASPLVGASAVVAARDVSGCRVVRLLPLRPLWAGVIVNTIFYAAVFWLLVALPRTLHGRVRRLLCRCPQCGYPIGGSAVCTECGRPLR